MDKPSRNGLLFCARLESMDLTELELQGPTACSKWVLQMSSANKLRYEHLAYWRYHLTEKLLVIRLILVDFLLLELLDLISCFDGNFWRPSARHINISHALLAMRTNHVIFLLIRKNPCKYSCLTLYV